MNLFKRKHYVVLYTYAIDGIITNGVSISGVTHSLRKAKQILADAVTDEREYAKKNGWEIITDTDMEFDAGEKMNYGMEHGRFYIQEV